MMHPAPILPTAPLEHPAMDYAFLRQEGLQHLARLAGQLWTDVNVHDPGITILEQVCYAITDLGYRIAYEPPDLLAGDGVEPASSLFSPRQILPSSPVTLADLRALVLDVDGVKNAWIEPVREPDPDLPLFFAASDQALHLQNEAGTASPVALQGLYRILIETRPDAQPILGTVASRLHAHRNLCEDVAEIRVLEAQPIQVQARIEIAAVENAEQLCLAIYQQIATYLSPAVRFATLSELRAAGKPIDEIFEGPLLEHGFIDRAELMRTQNRRTELRTSDLIQTITDVPGARAVLTISLTADGSRDPWLLKLDPHKVPTLDVLASEIRLERNHVTVPVHTGTVRERYDAWLTQHHTPADHARAYADQDLPLAAGRNRHVGTYHAIQHQFPAAYGIGEMGLPASATPQRQAQARQLKAYLMFFDQILANAFAQLAHVKDLLAFSGNTSHTYAAQMIDDPTLGVDEIRVQDPKAHCATLQQLTEADAETATDRRHRFLNHLLARCAEQFTEHALIRSGLMAQARSATAAAQPPQETLLQDKRAFLQCYPDLSRARGTGCNVLSPRSPAKRSALEHRLRLKLGIEDEFYLVEHILLRPLEGDTQQQVPLLAQACRTDPYSLQLSVVFSNYDPALKTFIAQTVREETPAHLIPYIHWLDQEAMTTFGVAYAYWLDSQWQYWTGQFGGVTTPDLQVRVRAARDRLLDLLGLGETYPLQDLAVQSEQPTVEFNTTARICIANSQQGVVYQLCDANKTPVTRPPVDGQGEEVPVTAEGNGATLYLETPPIRGQVTFTIHASKVQSGRAAYLHQVVLVGLIPLEIAFC